MPTDKVFSEIISLRKLLIAIIDLFSIIFVDVFALSLNTNCFG